MTSVELDSQPDADSYWRKGVVVDDEAHNADTFHPSPARPPFIAERRESALVVAYKAFLRDAGDTREQRRLKSLVGFSDLFLVPVTDGDLELVEAKSDAKHSKVREALAQALDYAAHAHEHLDALTALFPERPDDRDIQLLGNYGIGCVYRDSNGTFTRIPAPAHRVAQMKPLWQPGLQAK